MLQISASKETQAKLQQQSPTALTDASGDILNNTGCLDLRSTSNLASSQSSRHLVCSLRNMQLKKIKRAEKKGNECVMDEKFALLFQTKFQIFDLQLDVRQWLFETEQWQFNYFSFFTYFDSFEQSKVPRFIFNFCYFFIFFL